MNPSPILPFQTRNADQPRSLLDLPSRSERLSSAPQVAELASAAEARAEGATPAPAEQVRPGLGFHKAEQRLHFGTGSPCISGVAPSPSRCSVHPSPALHSR